MKRGTLIALTLAGLVACAFIVAVASLVRSGGITVITNLSSGQSDDSAH